MEDPKLKTGLANWASEDPIIIDDEGDYPPLPVNRPSTEAVAPAVAVEPGSVPSCGT